MNNVTEDISHKEIIIFDCNFRSEQNELLSYPPRISGLYIYTAR